VPAQNPAIKLALPVGVARNHIGVSTDVDIKTASFWYVDLTRAPLQLPPCGKDLPMHRSMTAAVCERAAQRGSGLKWIGILTLAQHQL
jgi:hypothetical protein